MANVISVITPVYLPSADHIQAAYDSLATQEMPHGWDWEWLVQEDGESGTLTDILPANSRISLGSGRHGGPGVARNLALARATGSLVKVLDADDILCSG